jgi:hypothetical protein
MVKSAKHGFTIWDGVSMKKTFLLFLLCVFTFAGAANAMPLKIIMIPSTDIQPYGTFHLGIENDTTMFSTKDVGAHSDPAIFGISAGILNAGTFQVDMGIDMRGGYDNKTGNASSLSFNGKISTTEEAFGKWGPTFTAGAYDFGTDPGTDDYNILYGEASKVLGFIGRLTAGYYQGNANLIKSVSGVSKNQGMMVGFDRRMTEMNDKLWFGIDYMEGTSKYGAVSFGIGWMFSEKATLILGYVRYNDSAVANPNNYPTVTSTSSTGANVITWQAHYDF